MGKCFSEELDASGIRTMVQQRRHDKLDLGLAMRDLERRSGMEMKSSTILLRPDDLLASSGIRESYCELSA